MRLRHALTHLLHKREHDKRRDGVADESRDDENETAEDAQNAVETHALDVGGDCLGDGVEQTGGVDGFAESEAAGGEDDDGPQEVVEVFFGEDAGSEEEHERDDGYDAHVAEDVFELVADAPQRNGDHSDDADKPLHAGELVLHRADRHDGRALAWLEGENKETPYQEDRDDAHRQRDEEPHGPRGLWVHVLKGNEVLRRSDR